MGQQQREAFAELDEQRGAEMRLSAVTRGGGRALHYWFMVGVVAVLAVLCSSGAMAAGGELSYTQSGYTRTFAVASNSCADVMAGSLIYAQSQGWGDSISSCAADPVIVGTQLTWGSNVLTVDAITATPTTGGGGTTPIEGSPTAIGPVDHITFAAGVLAIAFLLGLGAGWRS